MVTLTTASYKFIKQWQWEQWWIELPEEHFEYPGSRVNLLTGIVFISQWVIPCNT